MTTTPRLSGRRCDPRLTPRRQKILSCIHESLEGRGYPPSMREIAEAVGLKSTSAVSYQLTILEQNLCAPRISSVAVTSRVAHFAVRP